MTAGDVTELIVQFGWTATAGIHVFAALILSWVLFLQLLRRRKLTRQKALMQVWQPLLVECLIDFPPALPSVDPRDRELLLLLWNHFQETVRGQACDQLNVVAKQAGLDKEAMQYMSHRSLRHRLLAIATLGRLKEDTAWEVLAQLGRSENTILSLEAVHALIRINPGRAVPLVAQWIGRRSDWSPLKITSILSEAGPHVVADTLARIIHTSEPHVLARLIKHLASTRCTLALPFLREKTVSSKAADDVMAACLSFFGECSDPLDLPAIRAHLGHPTWFVRLQAAAALGKMGLAEDEILLIGLLDDSHWWVRYRAAEALTRLPSMTEDKMERLQASLPSLEAQEIIIPFMAKMRVKQRALKAA